MKSYPNPYEIETTPVLHTADKRLKGEKPIEDGLFKKLGTKVEHPYVLHTEEKVIGKESTLKHGRH